MQFAERYGPWAVVAGASEGIGASVARSLGEHAASTSSLWPAAQKRWTRWRRRCRPRPAAWCSI